MPEPTDATWLSLVPALVTIGLAFAARQVIPALFAGIVTGSLVLYANSGAPDDLNFISRFFLPALGTESYAKILLIYLWCLGGLIGIWGKTGGARHFAETVGAWMSRGPRSSLLFGWLVGILFHQGGTVSTVLAGTTVKPVADRHRISHEELSYVVDSTAAPTCLIIPISTWGVYFAGLLEKNGVAAEGEGIKLFIESIPYMFYPFVALMIFQSSGKPPIKWVISP